MTFQSPILNDHDTGDTDTGRTVNYLRISVTDRCNLGCRYCVPKASLPLVSHNEIARYEEILRIITVAADAGISKVRITGGEPLVRRGIFDFLKQIKAIQGIEDIAVTTNGVLLKKHLPELAEAGIKRINISLDTLIPDIFEKITGKPCFKKVWEAIIEAHNLGLSPIKLNSVILKGINDNEIVNLAALTLTYPFHVRFIEYMPMGNTAVHINQQVLVPDIKRRIESELGRLYPIARQKPDGPAKRFSLAGAPGEIGFISPVSSHFCGECNRLRLTASGKIRPCLLDQHEYDILTPLRAGASDIELKNFIIDMIKKKPASHRLNSKNTSKIKSQMSSIGG